MANSAFFEFLVTPSGTTFLEVLAWSLIFVLLALYRNYTLLLGQKQGSMSKKAKEDKERPVQGSMFPGLRQRLSQKLIPTVTNDAVVEASNCDKLLSSNFVSPYLKLLVIAYILDVLLFTVISFYLRQSILFIPTKCNKVTTEECNYNFDYDQEFYILNPLTNDTLHMILVKSKGPNPSRPILFTHGNSHNLAYHSFVQQYQSLTNLGLDVYAWDYPDYGKSSIGDKGRLNLERLTQDAAFMRTQVARHAGTDSSEVILWGYSMGAALSVAISMQQPANYLILQFPPDRFDWIVHEGTKLTGWLSTLPHYKVLDVYSWISQLQMPTRVLHLAASEDVYVTQSRQQCLFSRIPPNIQTLSQLHILPGLGHSANPFNHPGLNTTICHFLDHSPLSE